MSDRSEREAFVATSRVNVVGNAAKILVEGAAGIAFGSVALLADAAHSVADLISSVVVLFWGPTTYVGADEDHPHGHSRIEPLAALFVGVVIVLLGLYLLYESSMGILTEPDVTFSYLLLGALAFAILDMAAVYYYTVRANQTIDSTALRALAADCKNDIYTSMAAGVGVIGVELGYPVLDPIAGGVVSMLVIAIGIEIGRENLQYLAGRAGTDEQQADVRDILLSPTPVQGVHDLAVFYDGPVLEVEAHVEIDGDLTLEAAHELETELVEKIKGLDEVGDVHLHLDPAGIGEWKDAEDGDE